MQPKTLAAIGLFTLTLLYATGAKAGTVIPSPTPPPVPETINPQDIDTRPKVINLYCPKTIQVGPVGVPSGWQSFGALPRQRLSIQIDNQKRMVVCWYGTAGDNNLFLSQLIGKPLPTGYECTIVYPADYAAVCTRKPRPGR